MTNEDLKLLTDWFEANKDHHITLLEKEAVKMMLRKADTVDDLLQTVLKLLRNR